MDCATRERRTPRRRMISLFAASALVVGIVASTAGAEVPGPNGRIVFARYDPKLDDNVTYTVNPDGTDLQRLYPGASESPHWSPDGTRVALSVYLPEAPAVVIVTPDTGNVDLVPLLDPTFDMVCTVWSPDANRLACRTFGVTDPSRNGIYTIRVSDGMGLKRITSVPGGDDQPGSYSPDGKRLVLGRFDQNGEPVGLFVVKVNGTGLSQITPPGTILGGDTIGDWSPQGNDIVFTRRITPDVRVSIWIVHPDGSGLHEIHFEGRIPCGGALSDRTSRGCYDPTWSPNGEKIAFVVNEANGSGHMYTANVDGTDLTQVTRGGEESPDWGTHPPVS